MDVAEIKTLREALGLSQEQLARHLGVSFMTISRWERGHSKPSPLAIEKLEQMKKEWEGKLSPEDIIPKKGELIFRKKSGDASSFAHAVVELNLDDWIERRRPGHVLDWAIVKRYGKGRFEITRIGVKPKGA